MAINRTGVFNAQILKDNLGNYQILKSSLKSMQRPKSLTPCRALAKQYRLYTP